MLDTHMFRKVAEKGVTVKHCRRIEMRTDVYMLTVKWRHGKRDLVMHILLVFQDCLIMIHVDSLKGPVYYTEHLRREISDILHAVKADIADMPAYRWQMLYKKVDVRLSPSYVIQDALRYDERLKKDGVIRHDMNQLIRGVREEIARLSLPPHQNTDLFFQRIILYGYDGIQLVHLLEEEGHIQYSYAKSVAFPNAVCRFVWEGVDNPSHNREGELVKVWCAYLRKHQYSCEILLND